MAPHCTSHFFFTFIRISLEYDTYPWVFFCEDDTKLDVNNLLDVFSKYDPKKVSQLETVCLCLFDIFGCWEIWIKFQIIKFAVISSIDGWGICEIALRYVIVTGLHWWEVNIGWGNGLVSSGRKPLPEPVLLPDGTKPLPEPVLLPDGTKPLPQPVLTQFYVTIWPQCVNSLWLVQSVCRRYFQIHFLKWKLLHMYVFGFKFHRSLFLRVQLTTSHHWAR